MQFSCKQEDFSKALQIVSRAVATRSTLPILSGVLLEVEKDRLRCLGTDLEIGIETTIPIENTDGSGKFVLPGRTLADLARRLSSGPVHVEISMDNHKATLRAGRSVFHLNLLSADDFPTLPGGRGEQTAEVRDLLLHLAVRRTAFATLPEDSRPFLSSVLIELEGERLRAVATDINRMAIQEGRLDRNVDGKTSIMVPVRAMQEVGRLTSGDDEERVGIIVTDRQVWFTCREATLLSRLVQGQFPPYEQIIPKSASTTVEIERSRFIAALERISLMVSSIKMNVSQGQVHLSASGTDIGEAYEDLDAKVEGSPLEIGFNARYLMDFLKAVDGEIIRMKLSGPRSPVLMDVPDNEGYSYLVMPLILGGEVN